MRKIQQLCLDASRPESTRTEGVTVEATSDPPVGTSVAQLAERLVADVEATLCTTVSDRDLDGRVETITFVGVGLR